MVYNIGINDMPKGWKRESILNQRIYNCWFHMLERCYSEKYQKRKPTYKGCYVCERWLKLSKFVEDLPKIDNYDLWLNNPKKYISLDKDIKSNGKNKCYCLEQCIFVTNEENIKQSNKTMDYKIIQESQTGKGNSSFDPARLIVRQNKEYKIIDIGYQFEYIKIGFAQSSISACCNGRIKSTGKRKREEKFVFKYLSDVPEEDRLNYIRHNMQFKS